MEGAATMLGPPVFRGTTRTKRRSSPVGLQAMGPGREPGRSTFDVGPAPIAGVLGPADHGRRQRRPRDPGRDLSPLRLHRAVRPRQPLDPADYTTAPAAGPRGHWVILDSEGQGARSRKTSTEIVPPQPAPDPVRPGAQPEFARRWRAPAGAKLTFSSTRPVPRNGPTKITPERWPRAAKGPARSTMLGIPIYDSMSGSFVVAAPSRRPGRTARLPIATSQRHAFLDGLTSANGNAGYASRSAGRTSNLLGGRYIDRPMARVPLAGEEDSRASFSDEATRCGRSTSGNHQGRGHPPEALDRYDAYEKGYQELWGIK